MIAFIRGVVAQTSPDAVVLDVGGVGISVQCTPSTGLGLSVGDRVELATTLVVREESWSLYGFNDAQDRAVFELVQTVSGIGPRLALAILGTMTADQLRTAVAAEDLAVLTRVPGIGRKGAQRLVLELKDRLGPAGSMVASTVGRIAGWQSDVADGLMSLGWSARDAERAVEAVADQAAGMDPVDVAALLKSALRSLDRS
jgi:Holliday junction DNA helicase RuvA